VAADHSPQDPVASCILRLVIPPTRGLVELDFRADVPVSSHWSCLWLPGDGDYVLRKKDRACADTCAKEQYDAMASVILAGGSIGEDLPQSFDDPRPDGSGFSKVLSGLIIPVAAKTMGQDMERCCGLLLSGLHDLQMQVVQHSRLVKSRGASHVETQRITSRTITFTHDDSLELGIHRVLPKVNGLDIERTYKLVQIAVDGQRRYVAATVHESATMINLDVVVPVDGKALHTCRVDSEEMLVQPVGDPHFYSVPPKFVLTRLKVSRFFEWDAEPEAVIYGFEQDFRECQSAKTHDLDFTGWLLPTQGFVLSCHGPELQDSSHRTEHSE
jgi:hypothetical protein